MAFQNYISFYSLDNIGQLLVRLEKHCIALELLTSEVTEPWRSENLSRLFAFFEHPNHLSGQADAVVTGREMVAVVPFGD